MWTIKQFGFNILTRIVVDFTEPPMRLPKDPALRYAKLGEHTKKYYSRLSNVIPFFKLYEKLFVANIDKIIDNNKNPYDPRPEHSKLSNGCS